MSVSGKACLILVAMALVLCGLSLRAESRVSDGKPFVITADTPWIVPANPPEALERALADVQRDWYKVFGHLPIVVTEPMAHWRGPFVSMGIKQNGDGPESFRLHVQNDSSGRRILTAEGVDQRGAMYAAYALAEEILGVDPWYFWTDNEPKRRIEIVVPADLDRKYGPPTFRYRGWFINDEDLLSGFAPDPLRENVYSLDMFDRICETILRTRGNMIVPGTFNFPDERCWELATRRGLAVNMHHIFVCGLNTWRWPEDMPFSFTKHPEIMEDYWRQCIRAFKGREVVWSVGYRGKDDRPFWIEEPEFDTPEKRGEVITKAIARQVELIREVDPDGMIIANLWGEGSSMRHDGHLKLPEGVVQVWADEGAGIPLDRKAVEAGQGLYIHTAMLSGYQNQMSELVPPERIYREVGRFVHAGATSFILINTSDVRPVPLSTDCLMRFAWDAEQYARKTDKENAMAFYKDWCHRQFGKTSPIDEIADLYAKYFDLPFHQKNMRRGDNWWFTLLNKRDLTAGSILAKPQSAETLKLAAELRDISKASLPAVVQLADEAAPFLLRVAVERRDFFQSHLLSQIQLHRHWLELLDHYGAVIQAEHGGERVGAIAEAKKALEAMDGVYESLQRTETVKWAGWYQGNRLVPIAVTRDQIRSMLAALSGEPAPPVRNVVRLPAIWQYQEPFLKNFPMMYQKKD